MIAHRAVRLNVDINPINRLHDWKDCEHTNLTYLITLVATFPQNSLSIDINNRPSSDLINNRNLYEKKSAKRFFSHTWR